VKQKKLIKKLILNKATIAKLDQLDESKIQGGAWETYYCSNSCSPSQCLTQCYSQCFSQCPSGCPEKC
jgi:hypothetical protein